MNRPRLAPETILYAAAFLLALTLRLLSAGQLPLDNGEAGLALQSLALARAEGPQLDPQPAYLLLTGLLFFLFQASDWAARFWPVLAGSLLVLSPALYRQRLGRIPALLLAFFLALDPGLMVVSRQADSLSLALAFVLLAPGLLLARRWLLGGVVSGLALLSGPAVWPGALGLAAALWISGEWKQRWTVQPQDGDGQISEPGAGRKVLFAALITVFFLGTLFFTEPRGLSAMAGSLPAYLQGWVAPSGVPAFRLMMALLLYHFLPLIFGIWGAVHGLLKGQRLERFLLIWWAVALLLALIYPARQVSSLSWSLLPLWALAARQIARTVRVPRYDRVATAGHAVLVVVLLTFASMALVWLSSQYNPADTNMQDDFIIRIAWIAGGVVMLIASTGLIAWGWSREVAFGGLVWGILALFGAYTLSAGWNAAGLSGKLGGAELWANSPATVNSDLLLGTIQSFDEWGFGHTGEPDVLVAGVAQPSLRWVLRDVPNVQYVSRIPGTASPAIVITPAQPQLGLASSYRGQDFTIARAVSWDLLPPETWWRWLVFRRVPEAVVMQDQIILWARTDLFPGGTQQGRTQ